MPPSLASDPVVRVTVRTTVRHKRPTRAMCISQLAYVRRDSMFRSLVLVHKFQIVCKLGAMAFQSSVLSRDSITATVIVFNSAGKPAPVRVQYALLISSSSTFYQSKVIIAINAHVQHMLVCVHCIAPVVRQRIIRPNLEAPPALALTSRHSPFFPFLCSSSPLFLLFV